MNAMTQGTDKTDKTALRPEVLFTVGPTQMSPQTLACAGRQVPYFRNQAFSDVVLECERFVLEFAHAPQGSRMVLLTASGTGAMEATVTNCLDASDRALVIVGGSFGRRFSALCERHGIAHDDLELDPEEALTQECLAAFEGAGHTALLVNLHETSTGQLYDLPMLSDFCQRNQMTLVVDAISSFAADKIDMAASCIDALIVSSQKALALAPGISLVLLSPRMLEERVARITSPTLYFDFADYLVNGTRGQTPFTPAVGIVYELLERLRRIDASGGIDTEVARTCTLARDFRGRIAELNVGAPSFPMSNALTRVILPKPVAGETVSALAEEGLFVNPCGGALGERCFRVAHIGDLSEKDNAQLVIALGEVLESLGA